MNRRGFLASAIAAALVPKELISNTSDPWGGTFSNVLVPPADLSEASLERMLIDIQRYVSPRGTPIAIYPNAVKYTWHNSGKMTFQIVNLHEPKIIPGASDSSLARAKELLGLNGPEVYSPHILDGQSLSSGRHPTLDGRIGEYWCSVCESSRAIDARDQGRDFSECPECGL